MEMRNCFFFFSVKMLEYFGFKDGSSLGSTGCQAPREAAENGAVWGDVSAAACASPPMGSSDTVKTCPRAIVRREECYCSANTRFSVPPTSSLSFPHPYPRAFSGIKKSSSLSIAR